MCCRIPAQNHKTFPSSVLLHLQLLSFMFLQLPQSGVRLLIHKQQMRFRKVSAQVSKQFHVLYTEYNHPFVDSVEIKHCWYDLIFFQISLSILDIQNETPLFSDAEHRVSERNTPCHSVAVDHSDSEICRAIKTQSVVPQRDSSSPPTAWFSSRLSDLDVQLAALQKIADHLEKDFSNSRMVHKALLNSFSYFDCQKSLQLYK